MANPRYNSQVTQPRGNQTRVGKMGGGMMMQRPMYKAGGRTKKMSEAQKQAAKKTGAKVKRVAKQVGKMMLPGAALAAGVKKFRESKKAGGRIAGAARRAQQHGYYTPDMGMKGGKMYAKGGKVSGKKQIMAVGRGKIKNYPGIKKLIEMNKKGKKRFRDGGSATEAAVKARKKQERGESLKRKGLKPVDASQKGLKKLPTQVRNKMGYMKDGGFTSTQQKGNIVKGKLKSQKELKKITSSDAYKKASYHKKNEMLNRATHKDGGMTRNTRRMNRLEELGRVDSYKARTKGGRDRLAAEKKRIVKELRK